MARGFRHVAGIDEAGRGPWAGPVVAAAVILDPEHTPSGLDDSKRLTPARREALMEALVGCAFIGIGIAEAQRIDRDNLHTATLWAMTEAWRALEKRADFVLVDGKFHPDLDCSAATLIGGDRLCLSIAAASIVAKVTRDRIMCELAQTHPGYGFERHKGYGTAEHRDALEKLGPTPEHRYSFAPVRAVISSRASAQKG